METLYPLYTTGALTLNENYFYALIIGIVFGIILERAGFGRSTHIAPIFYFKNLRVSQVMVSAILTCATLLTISVYAGILDFNQIFIPTVYIWPYLVGGILFGLGMVMSGWCPGTAVVGFAVGKLDAAVFLLGVMVGMSVYFDQFDKLADFANSSNVGRLTIDNLVGGDIYSSLIITVFIGIGLGVFMHIMKSIREKKEEEE
ncbi:MAG: YeeE/YedE thiosulfate transporter family protein [Campylobacterota bacterium]|nr:YeeE/YedE thiosulfate transporter family protein [Campylobacterota bacterium]